MVTARPAYRFVTPAYCSIPEYTRTLGPVVADLAATAGLIPDPEQEMLLDAAFAIDDANRSAFFELAVVAARQNLKTGWLKMLALGWAYVTEQRLTVWSAHEFSTSQEAHRDLALLIGDSPALSKRLAPNGITDANGKEAIELVGGQRIRFKARTKSGGRGLTGNKVILDEAFALKPTHMGALMPTLSATPDPQLVYASSAGKLDAEVLRALRDRGRGGRDPRLVYAEWMDDLGGECGSPRCTHAVGSPDCRFDDRRRWRRANTALGRRITEEFIATERRSLPADEFAREILGWWEEPGVNQVFGPGVWEALDDYPNSKPGAPFVFAVDVNPEGTRATIAAGGVRPDGRIHVEVVEDGAGTAWVVDRLAKVKAKRSPTRPVLLDGNSPAAALIDPLEAAGVNVRKLTGQEVTQSCVSFALAVTEDTLRHIGQFELDDALAAAQQKVIGDGWRWVRRNPSMSISPLYAVTFARWGVSNALANPVGGWMVSMP